jgi:hypothetical protein
MNDTQSNAAGCQYKDRQFSYDIWISPHPHSASK